MAVYAGGRYAAGKRLRTVAAVGTTTRSPICISDGGFPASLGAPWKTAMGVPSTADFLSR